MICEKQKNHLYLFPIYRYNGFRISSQSDRSIVLEKVT